MASEPPTAAVVIIGNEVLSGRTPDANLQFLAQRLALRGIRLREARIVRDVEEDIIAAVDALRRHCDYVFTTGGIGPTHDDITAAAIARVFGVALHRSEEAARRLRLHYGDAGLNPARLRMADVPEGAALLDNPVSAAPGFRVGNVFVLPGVPMIMRAMFEALEGQLRAGPPIASRQVSAFTTESGIAGPLREVQDRHPTVEIGSYPFLRGGRFGVSLVARGEDADAVAAAARAIAAMLAQAGIEPIVDDADAAG
ncbi:MAG: molybdopterin-binding protein [Rhodospirillales bacterium]|nr:molybdopterin-binding protein [Rhodospirillales bacterium]